MNMCEAMRRIMKDEIEESRAKGYAEGYTEGYAEGYAEERTEGKLETLVHLVRKKLITPEIASMEAHLSAAEFEALMASYTN